MHWLLLRPEAGMPVQLPSSPHSPAHLSGQPGTLHHPELFSGVLRRGTTSNKAATLPPGLLLLPLPLPLPASPLSMVLGCCTDTRDSCRGPLRLRSGYAAVASAASTAAAPLVGGACKGACWAAVPAAVLLSQVSRLPSGSSCPAAPPGSPSSACALCGSADKRGVV